MIKSLEKTMNMHVCVHMCTHTLHMHTHILKVTEIQEDTDKYTTKPESFSAFFRVTERPSKKYVGYKDVVNNQ